MKNSKHSSVNNQIKPHPARALIEGDAADILDFNHRHVVHTVVQTAAQK